MVYDGWFGSVAHCPASKVSGPRGAGHCGTSGVPGGTNAADSVGLAHDPGEGGDGWELKRCHT